MAILDAENCFKRGLVALHQGKPLDAAALFESAMVIERRRGAARPQMRYLSYYGVSLAQAKRQTRQAIEACERAANVDFFDPNLVLNLGKVYLIAGKRTKALTTFQRGLRMAPSHQALRAELSRAERRRPLPIGFLSRNHPLNRLLGRLRSRFSAEPRAQAPNGEVA